MASAKGARTGAVWGSGVLQDTERQVLSTLGQGYNSAGDSLNQGYTSAGNSLTQGRDAAQGYLGQGQQVYAGMQINAQPGMDRYRALTTGDGASQSAALAQTPGYQFSMDQGLQALNRRRAAGGMLNSGNSDADAITFGSGLASQTLGAERQALLPYLGMYQQGAQGEAGVYGQQANNASNYFNNQAGLTTGYFGNQAALTTDYYGNRASVQDDTAKNIVGLGTEALKAGDAAKSANQAMMMQGVNAAVGLLGSGMGSGGMFTKMAFPGGK